MDLKGIYSHCPLQSQPLQAHSHKSIEPLSVSAITSTTSTYYPPTGFAGLTRRVGKKPIIAAVNGHAHGGGFEILLTSDLVIASSNATFCLPDVKRGTAALMGGLPRLTRLLGLQRATGVALLGERLSPKEALEWGLVWKVVDGGRENLINESVNVARKIAGMSPDSIIVSRAGVRQGLEGGSGMSRFLFHLFSFEWDRKFG